MPPRKRQQSNAMLYTLVAFVGLFIIATTFAVVYYVKAEDFRTRQAQAQDDLEEYASIAERQNVGSLVGSKQSQQTYLNKMLEHMDRVVMMATGTIPQDTTAEVKVVQVVDEVKSVMELTAPYTNMASEDPNTVGLTRIASTLKTRLDNTTNSEMALKGQVQDLQGQLDSLMTTMRELETTLRAEKAILEEEVNRKIQDYNDLEALLNQTATQREQNLMAQLNQEKDAANQLNQDLLRTNAQLALTREKLANAEVKIAKVQAPPDANVPAYRPDGRIILLNEANKVVHISIGSNDRVYRGLTFSVYDKGQGVPRDGKPKAEIQVFDVAESFSAARIINPDPKRPILMGDVIANVIWDGSRSNVFVIAGEFDLDDDGTVDRDAEQKLTGLIEKWGGKVAAKVTVDTDYLVLGGKPLALKQPTFEELEIDPGATRKFQDSQRMLAHYDEVLTHAQALWVPVLKYDRFLYFIGYKGQMTAAGAF